MILASCASRVVVFLSAQDLAKLAFMCASNASSSIEASIICGICQYFGLANLKNMS